MLDYNKKEERIMNITYERKINYYETDRIGIDMPFDMLEENGVTIPVLGVNVTYKHHVTFADVLEIKVFIKEYNGVRMTIGYDVKNKKTGDIVIIAETKHCFTDRNLKPLNLKKYAPEFSNKYENLLEKQ